MLDEWPLREWARSRWTDVVWVINDCTTSPVKTGCCRWRPSARSRASTGSGTRRPRKGAAGNLAGCSGAARRQLDERRLPVVARRQRRDGPEGDAGLVASRRLPRPTNTPAAAGRRPGRAPRSGHRSLQRRRTPGRPAPKPGHRDVRRGRIPRLLGGRARVLGAVEPIADRVERLAFNALPASTSYDEWAHQYDQQANQVVCHVTEDRIYTTNGPDANVFGLEPHFGCCTANRHQGWPRFTTHLWMHSEDGALTAVSYAPCSFEYDGLHGRREPAPTHSRTTSRSRSPGSGVVP